MVMHACNCSTQEAEAGIPRVQGQHWLHSGLEAVLQQNRNKIEKVRETMGASLVSSSGLVKIVDEETKV